MAGFNRFEQVVPIQWNLPKTDLGVLAGVLESKQKRFDTGYELANQLSKTSIEALPQDRARANELMLEWETQKKNIVDSYSGDYSSAYRDLRRLEADMTKQLSPGGEANAIAANKKAFAEWYSTAAKDKEVNPDTLNAAYSYYMSPEGGGYFKGTGKQDPITGNYSVFNPEQILPSINPDDVVLPAIKELEAEGYEREYDQISGMWKLRHKETGKEVSYDRVFNTAAVSLNTNTKYLPGLQQELRFRGTGVDVNQQVSALAHEYAKNFSYGTNSKSTTMDANQVALHFDTEARKDARQNQMLGNIGDMFNPQKGYMDYSANTIGKELNVSDFEKALVDKNRSLISSTGVAIPGMGSFNPSYNKQDYKSNLKEFKGQDINNLISTGEFEKRGGNVNLMKTVLEINPNANANELFNLYNKHLQEIGSTMKSGMKVFDNKTGEAISQQMLESGMGQFTTIRVQSTGELPKEIPYQEFMKQYGKEIYKEDGTVKPQYKTMNTLVDASSGVNPSFVFKVGDKTVYMEAPPAYTKAMSPVTELSQAFNSPSGRAMTKGLGELEVPYINPQTGKTESKNWRNTPVELVVTYEKINGKMTPVKKLYEYVYNKEANKMYPVEASMPYNNPKTGQLEYYPLNMEMIEQGLDEAAFPKSFGTIQQTAKNSFYNDNFGNKIRVE